jgi:hypothetical protein
MIVEWSIATNKQRKPLSILPSIASKEDVCPTTLDILENMDRTEMHTLARPTVVMVEGHAVPVMPERRILYVEEQYRNPKLINCRRTMATKVGGKYAGSIAFLIIKKTVLWSTSLFFLSCVVGLLCYFGILPSKMGWLVFAGILPTINFWTLSSPHVLQKLLSNFDIWYMAIQATLAAAGMMDASLYDGRVGLVLVWWFCVIGTTFVDAAHVSTHRYNVVNMAIGLLGTALFVPCTFFGVFPNLRSRDISIGLSNNSDESGISIDTIFFTVDRLTTVLLFLSKNVWLRLRYPNCYLNLKARIKCEKVTSEEFETMKRKFKMTVRKLSFLEADHSTLQQTRQKQQLRTGMKNDVPCDRLTLPSGNAQGKLRTGPDPSNESSQHEENQTGDIVLTELNGLNLQDDDLVRVMMVEQDFMGFVTMSSSDTLVATLFGKSKGDWVFAVIKHTGLLFLHMWVVGLILALLCMFEVVPSWVGYIAFSMGIPCFLSCWALCSPHRALWLACSFEAWYLATLSSTAFAFAMYIFEHDGRILALLYFWSFTTIAIFFDAGHVSFAKYAKYYFACAIGFYVTFVVSLYLGGFPSVDNRDLHPAFFGVNVRFNVITFIIEKCVVVLVFLCKNFYSTIVHPGRYVSVTAQIKHEKMRVEELRRILQNRAGSAKDIQDLHRTAKSLPLSHWFKKSSKNIAVAQEPVAPSV